MFGWLKGLAAKIFPFLKPVFNVFKNAAGEILRQVALETVLEIQKDNSIVTDDRKRMEAYDKVKQRVEKAGHNAKDSAINFAIEWAVQELKRK